jgi:hypothetical protein
MTVSKQRGVTTVEFAIVGLVLLVSILGAFEVGRGFYTSAMLDEITRRGARLAAVCPINDPAISRLAILNSSGDGGASAFVSGLQPANVIVEYLDANNTVIANPEDPSLFLQIEYVRARISGFTYRVSLPFVAGLSTLTMSDFVHVLPRESLGVPREGAITPC